MPECGFIISLEIKKDNIVKIVFFMEYYIINLTIGRSIDSYKCFGIITIACSTFFIKKNIIYLFIIYLLHIFIRKMP